MGPVFALQLFLSGRMYIDRVVIGLPEGMAGAIIPRRALAHREKPQAKYNA